MREDLREDAYGRERARMVEKQLVRRGIRDERVLEAMSAVPRHRFVGDEVRASAYADCPLPIGMGQTISQPYMVALMTECLAPGPEGRVLEIGTGSGYQTAVLAGLAGTVYSVERIGELSEHAREVLDELGILNVKLSVHDGTKGWPESAPYDGIIVTAGAPRVAETLTAQLVAGGRLVIPVGGERSQDLLVVRRSERGIETKSVCGCVFVPLVGENGWDRQ